MPLRGKRDLGALIRRKFKTSGLLLQRPARELLQDALSAVAREQDFAHVQKALSLVLDNINTLTLKSNAIDRDTMEQVLSALNNSGGTTSVLDRTKMFQIVNAFEVPAFDYDPDKKRFLPHKTAPTLAADADAKSAMFRHRFNAIRQRLLRRKEFATHASANSAAIKLTTVDALLGLSSSEFDDDDDSDSDANELDEDGVVERAQRRTKGPLVTVLGMISLLQEDKCFLEDPDGKVELVVQNAVFPDALLTETSIILVEGVYRDRKLYAHNIASPPAEPRAQTDNVFSGTNFFGGHFKEDDRAALIEEEMTQDSMFVILSDVWLDKPEVLAKLRTLFEGYSGAEPETVKYILMGNFLSAPYGKDARQTLEQCFNELADIIAQFNITSDIVLVPGPLDPGSPSILPRPPLPTTLTRRFRTRVPNATFTTNPARLRFGAQEIVLFREDLTSKLRRNCLLPPRDQDGNDAEDIKLHVIKTLVDQSTLVPLPLHVRPVMWGFSQALQLYPVPDVLVTGDRTDTSSMAYEGCVWLNPGAFFISDYSFLCFYPGRARADDPADTVEYCKVP
ncbi:hypothetical protein PTSG_00131 [Salpingoeca rosetta]|uniref:DNA polymerase epsilon subunit n=1 Tax=Salpingoeca rosetta (strain ATCC 50818 / BSB-021) TaxID=946362 RepID=F2TVL8_SALR5|nr:uncharacterized protein PTSG_00131 [Salpingoeca rosetta]EGD72114.1 hypothetical protein PTSG_00131 [Salpingoeca rosetta]|eukprot:XP_004998686.1 hypothetical protein PTSG_00131 [Salpingoeca rosetta]